MVIRLKKKNENEIIPKCRPFEKEFYILRPYGMGESFGTAWSTNGVKRSHYKKIIKQVVPVGLILEVLGRFGNQIHFVSTLKT
jgi:hypothetical protein